MGPRQDDRFEFVLKINGRGIICQRYFDIRDFNEDSINSLEMKELMDVVMGMNNDAAGSMGIIPKHLKQKSKELLWRNYKPWKVNNENDNRSINEKNDVLTFEFRVDGRTVASSHISANVFPPKVRYKINIKVLTDCFGNPVDKEGNYVNEKSDQVQLNIIPDIMREIRDYTSRTQYTKNYAEISLEDGVLGHTFMV
jgi:hypothetical protein